MSEPILFLVSNGLLEHKPRMGAAIWEYLWFIDRVTKDEPDGKGKFNGLVLGGQPVPTTTIARDLREHVNTAKANIKALEVGGYLIRRRRPDNRCSYVVTNSKKWFWNRRNSERNTGTENCASPGDAGTENCVSLVQKPVPARTETCTSNKERHDSDTTVKPSVARAPVGDHSTDPRHAPIRGLIQKLHLEKFRVKCEWDGSEAKKLECLLSANPSWTEAQISAMVRNRFDSEEIASDRPRKWLPSLGSYASGPLDRYRKPKTPKANGHAAVLSPSEIARRQQAGEEWRQ